MAERLTPSFLQSLLSANEPGLAVSDVCVHPGSGRGDNYTAMLYRVHVSGTIKETEESWERSLIYKCLPTSAERRQAYRSDALFSNEVMFYTRTLPALLDFQRSRGVPGFSSVPRCYTARQDLLLLEDLRARNFQMLDRKAGLDLSQCEAVLTELAKFHALSIAMRELEPETFANDVTNSVREAMFLPENEEWYRDYYAAVCKNAVAGVRELLDGDYVARFEHFTTGFFQRMTSLVHDALDEACTVVCHGDCWTNNILFRLEPTTQRVLEVSLLDFQLARIGSPALDLANLLYCCTSHELRERHLDALLKHYHASLAAALQQLGASDDLFPFSELKNHMRRYSAFGLGLALDMIPISTCESAEAPDLYCGQSADEDQAGCALLQAVPTREAKRRMAQLVQELVDLGYV